MIVIKRIMTQLQSNKKIAYISLLIALSLIFSYIETLIPINFGIAGVKIGLANIISVIALYLFGITTTLFIVSIRVILSGFLFGNLFSIIYSLVGGLLSICIMYFLKKTNKFSIIGASIGGGVFHNVGQLLVAMIVINELKLYFYFPVLIISGVIMGSVIGIISSLIINRVETYVRL